MTVTSRQRPRKGLAILLVVLTFAVWGGSGAWEGLWGGATPMEGGGHMSTRSHTYNVFADYRQVYLMDDDRDVNTAEIWTDEASARWLAVGPKVVAFSTARGDEVPVTVTIQDTPPDDDAGALARWDHVVEAGLALPSGRLVVMGPTEDYDTEAARITVAPGSYRVRIYMGNLGDIIRGGWWTEPDDDHYHVVLWPSADATPRVVWTKFAAAPRSSEGSAP